MKDCLTVEAVVLDEYGVKMCGLVGEVVYLKESFKMSYDHAPDDVKKVLQSAFVDLRNPQIVLDGKSFRTCNKRLDRVPFLDFIAKDYGEHSLAANSFLFNSYLSQLRKSLNDDIEYCFGDCENVVKR